MNWDTYSRALYALCIWREARGEGELGMRAVGHVVWNRHRGGRSIIRVITDDAQFTSINPPGKTYDPQLAGKASCNHVHAFDSRLKRAGVPALGGPISIRQIIA